MDVKTDFVAGGSGSGKTKFVEIKEAKLGTEYCGHFSQDSFYLPMPAETPMEVRNVRNWDDWKEFDVDLFIRTIVGLKEGRTMEIPVWDYANHQRFPNWIPVFPKPQLFVDGLHLLVEEEIRRLADFKYFILADDDVRLIRRIRRDMMTRGRTWESIIRQWETSVQPMYKAQVFPSQRYADLIVPHGGEDMKVHHLLDIGYEGLIRENGNNKGLNLGIFAEA